MNSVEDRFTVKKEGIILYFALRRPTGSTLYVRCHEDFANEVYDKAMDNGWSISKTTDSLYWDRAKYGRTAEAITAFQTDELINKLDI